MSADTVALWFFWSSLPFIFTGDYSAGALWFVVLYFGRLQTTYDLQVMYFFYMFTYLVMWLSRQITSALSPASNARNGLL